MGVAEESEKVLEFHLFCFVAILISASKSEHMVIKTEDPRRRQGNRAVVAHFMVSTVILSELNPARRNFAQISTLQSGIKNMST